MSNEEARVSEKPEDENVEPEVPFHERTYKMRVRGETVEVPTATTIREIKDKLPPDLLAEFTERLENTWGYAIKFVMAEWGLPLDKLLEYRREQDEVMYREYTGSTDYPDVIDLDEIYDLYVVKVIASREEPPRDVTLGHPVLTSYRHTDEVHAIRQSGYRGPIYVHHPDFFGGSTENTENAG